jgi:hypothetical protein
MRTRSYLRLALFIGRIAWAPAAGAQDSARVEADTLARITFRLKWDVHNQNVRFRLRADSVAAWSLAKAVRLDGRTFQVVDDLGRPLLVRDPRSFEVRAFAPASDIRGHHVTVGAVTGGVLAAGAVVVYAFTCGDRHTDGVPCGIVITAAPEAGLVGAILGGIAGAIWPVGEQWQRVMLTPTRSPQ